MPLYEYHCKACSRRFEQLVFASTEPACPDCQGKDLEKLLSSFAVGVRGGAGDAPRPGGACGSCGDPRGPGACAID